MKKRIIEIITTIIEENDIDVSGSINIDENTTLVNDLGFNSFNLAQLTVEIESEFNIDIFENGIITSVEDILKQLK